MENWNHNPIVFLFVFSAIITIIKLSIMVFIIILGIEMLHCRFGSSNRPISRLPPPPPLITMFICQAISAVSSKSSNNLKFEMRLL